MNGYYSGYLSEEMSVAELAAGVRHHYDNGLNNIAPFMEAHSDELPPDVLEAAREKPMLPDCLSMSAPTVGTTSTHTPMTAT